MGKPVRKPTRLSMVKLQVEDHLIVPRSDFVQMVKRAAEIKLRGKAPTFTRESCRFLQESIEGQLVRRVQKAVTCSQHSLRRKGLPTGVVPTRVMAADLELAMEMEA